VALVAPVTVPAHGDTPPIARSKTARREGGGTVAIRFRFDQFLEETQGIIVTKNRLFADRAGHAGLQPWRRCPVGAVRWVKRSRGENGKERPKFEKKADVANGVDKKKASEVFGPVEKSPTTGFQPNPTLRPYAVVS